MLDLAGHSLIESVLVEGKAYPIHTDFRYWLRFGKIIKEAQRRTAGELFFLFKGEIPDADFLKLFLDFYINPNPCPHGDKKGEELIDWEMDGEYIYAAFLQQYSIDLVDAKLHWHKFKALLNGLTDDTMLGKIMQWRAYDGKDKEFLKLKNQWALPLAFTEEEKEKIKEFDEYFG